MKTRRSFLKIALIAAPVVIASCKSGGGSIQRQSDGAPLGMKSSSTSSGKQVDAITKSEEEWRNLLTPQQFDVLRNEGTERSGTSPLNNEKRQGQYLCAGCGLPLFESEDKYESGTGWPSFTRVIPGAVETKEDRKLFWSRTEYHCARCGGHQGHVFDDGPKPTETRYCNNGVALTFEESK